MKTGDGGPAFSRPSSENTGMTGMRQSDSAQEGMSLRDYFAAMAMQGLLAGGGHPDGNTAKSAYDMAELMIVARSPD